MNDTKEQMEALGELLKIDRHTSILFHGIQDQAVKNIENHHWIIFEKCKNFYRSIIILLLLFIALYGDDIAGACGQLAAREATEEQ